MTIRTYTLEEAILKLAEDRNLKLTTNEIKEIKVYIDRIANYLGKRAYHLMNHCGRKSINLTDIKNATRIELKEELIENLIKYSNYVVTRYFEIRKGYSIELLNELFNYERLCPNQILLELDIIFPFNYFREHLKLLKAYSVKTQSTIFLIALIQSLTINILNSLNGIRKDKPRTNIETVLNNYKCHSDFIW